MPTAKEVVADILDEAICLTRDDAIEMIEALSERGYVIVPKEPTEAMMPCPHCPADGFIIHRARDADEDATPK